MIKEQTGREHFLRKVKEAFQRAGEPQAAEEVFAHAAKSIKFFKASHNEAVLSKDNITARFDAIETILHNHDLLTDAAQAREFNFAKTRAAGETINYDVAARHFEDIKKLSENMLRAEREKKARDADKIFGGVKVSELFTMTTVVMSGVELDALRKFHKQHNQNELSPQAGQIEVKYENTPIAELEKKLTEQKVEETAKAETLKDHIQEVATMQKFGLFASGRHTKPIAVEQNQPELAEQNIPQNPALALQNAAAAEAAILASQKQERPKIPDRRSTIVEQVRGASFNLSARGVVENLAKTAAEHAKTHPSHEIAKKLETCQAAQETITDFKKHMTADANAACQLDKNSLPYQPVSATKGRTV